MNAGIEDYPLNNDALVSIHSRKCSSSTFVLHDPVLRATVVAGKESGASEPQILELKAFGK